MLPGGGSPGPWTTGLPQHHLLLFPVLHAKKFCAISRYLFRYRDVWQISRYLIPLSRIPICVARLHLKTLQSNISFWAPSPPGRTGAVLWHLSHVQGCCKKLCQMDKEDAMWLLRAEEISFSHLVRCFALCSHSGP